VGQCRCSPTKPPKNTRCHQGAHFMKMGGTGSTRRPKSSPSWKSGRQKNRIPFKGGGDVAVRLVGTSRRPSTTRSGRVSLACWRSCVRCAHLTSRPCPTKVKLIPASLGPMCLPAPARRRPQSTTSCCAAFHAATGVHTDQSGVLRRLVQEVRALPEWNS
jgi:hypothetical protein